MEIQPVLALLAAIGLFELLSALTLGQTPAPSTRMPIRLQSAAFLLIILLAGPAVLDLQAYAQREQGNQATKRTFLRRVADLPKPAIVFVRYGPDHSPFLSLVENGADFRHQRVWMAYDRGSENVELQEIAPERRAFLFDEQANSLRPYPPAGRTAVTIAPTR